MPRTPEKKRPGSQVASPEINVSKSRPPFTSAATDRNNTDKRRKRKNYQFAPVNNLDNKNKPENSVLKSISVSQVRNTAYSNTKKVQRSKQQSKAPIETNIRQDPILKPIRRQESLEEGPTEEVIWKYSPIERDLSDKANSSNDYSEDNVHTERYQDPSSTPMVPSRLKSVLSFCNINDREQSEPAHATLSLQQRDSLRSRGTNESMKESLRDIDDILGDIEGDFSTKPRLTRTNDLPSSPSGIQQRRESVEEDYEDDDSNEGDESLIKMLTQKPTLDGPEPNLRPPISQSIEEAESKVTSAPEVVAILPKQNSSSDSELYDDSLLDYFEENDKNNSNTNNGLEQRDHEDLDHIQNQLSQNLNIEMKYCANESETFESKDALETQEFMELAKSAATREGLSRFVILNVSELQLPKVGRQKILNCIDDKGQTSSVMVRHPWVYLKFYRGDVIHIIEGQNVANKRLLSDDVNPNTQLKNDNLLILNPDILLSATTVGNSIGCLRRSVIEAIFDDPRGESNIAMTIGNIVHELLQEGLRCKLENQQLKMEYLEELLESLLKTYSFAIFVCNYTLEQVKEDIMSSHAANVLNFINQFVKKSNFGSYVSVSGRRTSRPISIPTVLDIEENIWSHIYGLKGFLDATVLAHEEKKHEIVPLEVKTGKIGSLSHEAQGLIYTLLLNDKYDIPVDFFLLLQTRTNNFIKHPTVLHSIKHLLMARNELATNLRYRLNEITKDKPFDMRLPPILQSSFCDNCLTKEPCMVMNNLLEEGTAEESGLRSGEYEQITDHLSMNHGGYKAFFEKYNNLITQEESSIMNVNKQLFLLDSKTKESISGLCLSNLHLVNISEEGSTSEEFLHEFQRNSSIGEEPQSMLLSQLNLNDFVLISDENGHFGLCQGRIVSITKDSIKIKSKKRLRDPKTVAKELLSNVKQGYFEKPQSLITYRLDKNVIEQGLSLTRFNLLNLFLPPITDEHFAVNQRTGQKRHLKKSEGGDDRMRAFLVDRNSPRFIPSESPPLISFEPTDELESFNDDQRKAVEKVMRTEDYALILGMPGSGKTTVIAKIIKILASKGKKVLLTSYTHSAVDNILLKLKGLPINIIRLGSARKIHPEVLQYQPSYQDAESYEEIIRQVADAQVVATTCLGLNDIFFTLQQEDFDYAILDEASQISMPIALGPLRYASKFIMVGDHYQLPPLVKNEEARIGGLEESLFKILCETQPQAVFELTFQYRMCDDIAALSNFLIYNNKLKCGNEQVAKKKIDLKQFNALKTFYSSQKLDGKDWLSEILDPHRKVVFLNYDLCEELLFEINEHKVVTNPGEVDIVEQCVKGLIYAGLNCRDIGVMTLYRAQLHLLRKRFASHHYNDLEILTADQFQGRDKESIIISLVRSNKEHNAGTLLKELRRVNVAMTRAKSKLIIIGSQKTVSSVTQMAQLLSFLRSKGWIYDLPPYFRYSHEFPSLPSPSHNSQETNKSQREFRNDNNSPGDRTRSGAKNITASSRITQGHPIIKQTLSEL